MIDFNSWFESWPLDLQIAFLLAPFVIVLSGLAIGAYMAVRHLDEMKSAFPTSPLIRNQMSLWGGSDLPSRILQLGAIGGAVLWPASSIRRGELDPDEVRNFPPRLKRLLRCYFWLLAIGMAWIFLGVTLRKLSG